MSDRCKSCNTVVIKNYDHVSSDCDEPGSCCSGTYRHPSASTCTLRGRDIKHHQVVSTTGGHVPFGD